MFSRAAVPSESSFNRTLLRSLGSGVRIRRPLNPIQNHVSGSTLRVCTSLKSERRFATAGNSAQSSTATVTVEGLIPATPRTSTSRIPKQYQPLRAIRTLDPVRLTPDDYIDISSRAGPYLRVILQHPSPQPPRRPSFSLYVQTSDWSSGVFPPGTYGSLYYHIPPHSPPLAGELRFRIAPSHSDLLTDAGLPWRYPLWKIMCRDECRDVAALLVQDGLVSQEILDAALEAAATLRGIGRAATDDGATRLAPSPVLSTLWQEFAFRFDGGTHRRYLLAGRDSIVRQGFVNIPSFKVRRRLDMTWTRYFPFKGSAVCRFERSALLEHAGRRVVVLRVVRLLATDPISYVPAPDGEVYEALWPREGELMKIIKYGQVQPWAVDVDNFQTTSKLRRSLKILFENEELYGSPRNFRRR